METQLMAVVAKGSRSRVYLPPSDKIETAARTAQSSWIPEQEMPKNPRWFSPPDFGMTTYGDLFTPRQLVALTTFSDLVADAREKALADAKTAGLPSDQPRLTNGGTGAEAYADAVATYLGFAVDRASDAWSTISTWASTGEFIRNTFSRQAIPMTWDYSECNPFSETTGNFEAQIGWISRCFCGVGTGKAAFVKIDDITKPNSFKHCFAISSDPPYYDNIGYADLSDFFYVWLRRSLKGIYPELFATMLVPKSEELVATPYRHGSKQSAEAFFMAGMGKALANMAAAAHDGYPVTIYYAFKQSEVEREGVASTGWATFLQALIAAGFSVDGTWPVRTERSARSIGIGTNALASSIVLICRKRPAAAPVTTRADFIRTLRMQLPGKLKLLQQGNIAPVDMAQASIGPGMAVFTRYANVLEADDSPMTVKTALKLINEALDAYLSEQEGDYDADTRFAITWFETHGMDLGPYGTAETLAMARGVAVSGVEASGVLNARGGKVRLLKREEMPDDWDPATDTRLTVWECTQHLIRKLETEGESSAADLLARLGEHGEVARNLAYRLYGICERKKWADEALAYNGLVVAWPELTRLAAQVPTGPAQAELEI
jgi:putative DNA methylase